MRPAPLVVSLAAVIVAACSGVPAPGPAMPLPASTTLQADASELVSVKGFVRSKYFENKPWRHRHAKGIQVMVPPLLPDQYIYVARVEVEDLEQNWHGRVLQMGIAHPVADKIDVQWDHVLEGGCIKPVPSKSGCYEDMNGGPNNVPQFGAPDLFPEVGKSIILTVGGNQVTKSRVPKTRSESPDSERSGAPEVSIKPQVIKVGPKGVITIPDENRRAMDLEPGKYVTAIQVGRSLVLSPEINEFLAIAEQFQLNLAASGTTTQALLDGLASARQELTEELYGSPRKARRGA